MSEIKNSPWKNFSTDLLQDYIGKKTLEDLSYYLPLLRSEEFNQSNLYKKNNLSAIFNSFSGSDLLEKKEFRKNFFSSLTDDLLKRVFTLVFSEAVHRIFRRFRPFISFSLVV